MHIFVKNIARFKFPTIQSQTSQTELNSPSPLPFNDPNGCYFFHPTYFHVISFSLPASSRHFCELVSQAFNGAIKNELIFLFCCCSSPKSPLFLATTGLLPSKFPCYLFICVSKHKFLSFSLSAGKFFSAVPAINTFCVFEKLDNAKLEQIQRLWSLNNNKTVKLCETQPLSIYLEFCHHFLQLSVLWNDEKMPLYDIIYKF